MDGAEYSQYQADQATNAQAKAVASQMAADKAAPLTRLGLTEDELKTILS